MKLEWRKHEKSYYLPGKQPAAIEIPAFKFFSVCGTGNPNSDYFKKYIEVLYSLAYAVKMSYKWNTPPENYSEYTVYPLEGVWDIADKTKHTEGKLDKNNLTFNLMIRQPDFLTADLALEIIERVKMKKPNQLLDSIEFSIKAEGLCVQLLHLGSYDDEPESFSKIENYIKENSLQRLSKAHREIYLSDPRRTETSKLKTVLRVKVKKYN